MQFNEINLLFIINVIFVLILNLNDYKSSIVLEFKSFFETHVYTVLPPIFQIIASTFVNTLFDFLLMNEKINKSIENLYTKSNLSVKAKENPNVLLSTSVFALSNFMFIIEICLHFVLLALFFIYVKQIITFLTSMENSNESKEKSKAYLLIIIGFVFYRIVNFLVNIKYKVTLLQFTMYCVSFCVIMGVSLLSYYFISKYGYENDIVLPDMNMNENMRHFLDLFNNLLSFFPIIVVGLLGIYVGLTIMFVFYDILFDINYDKNRDHKRKMFYSFFFIMFAVVISRF